MTNSTIERFYSINELGELGIGKKSKIYTLIKQGVFNPVKFGTNTRIRASEVQAYIKQNQLKLTENLEPMPIKRLNENFKLREIIEIEHNNKIYRFNSEHAGINRHTAIRIIKANEKNRLKITLSTELGCKNIQIRKLLNGDIQAKWISKTNGEKITLEIINL